MKTKDVIRAVQEHKGPIYTMLHCKNDVVYVQVVKSDLLLQLSKLADNELNARQVKDDLYLESCF